MGGLSNKQYPSNAEYKGSVDIGSHKVVSLTLTPASLAANLSDVEAFAIPASEDVKLGDIILGGGPQYDLTTAVMAGEMWVSADDEISISFTNPTAGALVPAAGKWIFLIGRPG